MSSKIDRIIEEKLENSFHMNERLDDAKKNLVFKNKNRSNKNYFIPYLASTLVLCVIIGVSTFFVTKNIYKDLLHGNVVYMEEYQQDAIEYMSKYCETIHSISLITYTLEQDFFLSIYEGIQHDKYIYFYQFGAYVSSKYLIDIEFFNEKNEMLKIVDIKNSTIGVLTSDTFNTDCKVFFNYYRNNEKLITSQLF